ERPRPELGETCIDPVMGRSYYRRVVIDSTERAVLAALSPALELAILRAEYEREVQARRDLERRVQDAEQLERALRLHLTQVDRLQRQLSGLCGAVVSTIS